MPPEEVRARIQARRQKAALRFDYDAARETLLHGAPAEVAEALEASLAEVQRLRTRLSKRQAVEEDVPFRRVTPDDGGAAMLVPEATREGDIITLPTGRMYKVVSEKEAMLQNDLGPIPLAPRLTR